MNIKKEMLVLIVVLSLLISGCTPGMTTNTPSTTTITPKATPISLPKITLTKGDYYFKVDGKPAFVFSRNLCGYQPNDYALFLDMARKQDNVLVRVGTDNGAMGGYSGYGYTKNGEIREDWAKNWENFFEIAEAKGIYVIPTFTGWINWNNTGYNTWSSNPFNSAIGGPAKDPIEILKKDSPTQLLYLKWFKDVVKRWSKHNNILAWEGTTEINLINGVTQKSGQEFSEQLAEIVNENDPLKRPNVASLADFGDWSNYLNSPDFDIISIHPYPLSGRLDRNILESVPPLIRKYKRPVMIGESGLSFLTPDSKPATLTTADNAAVGIKHAIWGSMVSGSMNGRALWWEDSFAIYFPELSWPFLNRYTDIELSAAKFIKEVDYFNFKPLAVQFSATITGAAIGNEQSVVGWFRDASCEPPDWKIKPVISKQSVAITVPGSNANWRVDFYNTKTGADIISSATLIRKGKTVIVNLPDFNNDIAFKLYPISSTQ